MDRLRRESARLWNDILDHHWWLWQTWRVWTNEAELKKWFNAKDYALHSQTIQAVIELHQETCQRTYEQRAKGKALRSLHRLRNKKLGWFGQYKGKLHGIVVEKIEESYTTGTCPACGHYHKRRSRTFRCPKCLATGHRDVIGAVNIRDKALHGTITTGRALPQYQDTTYRQADLGLPKKAVA